MAFSTSKAQDLQYAFQDPSVDPIRSITDDIEHKLSTQLFVQQQEETRAHIGKIFVWWFFIVLILSSLGTLVYNFFMYLVTSDKTLFIDIGTIIPLVWSIIGTPLWFVMGYYFKDDGSPEKHQSTPSI